MAQARGAKGGQRLQNGHAQARRRRHSQGESRLEDSYTLEVIYHSFQEYAEVQKATANKPKQYAFTANPTLNRSKDIVCLDVSRVTLNYLSPPENDYMQVNS